MKWEVWTANMWAELTEAAEKAGMNVEGLKFEACTTEATWGDRCGLVFFGAAPEVNERAAKWFEKWAAKNLTWSSYEAQRSVGFAGEFRFTRWANGAKGWHKVWPPEAFKFEYEKRVPVVGEGDWLCDGTFHNKCEEIRLGFATSYVYYPCAD